MREDGKPESGEEESHRTIAFFPARTLSALISGYLFQRTLDSMLKSLSEAKPDQR
jgi:hypothetical protein